MADICYVEGEFTIKPVEGLPFKTTIRLRADMLEKLYATLDDPNSRFSFFPFALSDEEEVFAALAPESGVLEQRKRDHVSAVIVEATTWHTPKQANAGKGYTNLDDYRFVV